MVKHGERVYWRSWLGQLCGGTVEDGPYFKGDEALEWFTMAEPNVAYWKIAGDDCELRMWLHGPFITLPDIERTQ